jgi:hypothetical protein
MRQGVIDVPTSTGLNRDVVSPVPKLHPKLKMPKLTIAYRKGGN